MGQNKLLPLDDKMLDKYKRKCLLTAKRNFSLSKEDAEDFAQEYLLMLTTKKWRQTPDQACIDFIRKCFGRTGEYGAPTRKIIPISLFDIDAEQRINFSTRNSRIGSNNSRECCGLDDIIKDTTGNARIVLVLLYVWGFTYVEIGRVLGVSESRIAQLHSAELYQQKKRIKKETTCKAKRKRQQMQSAALSFKIQTQRPGYGKEAEVLARICEKKGQGVGSIKTKKISEALQRPFRVNSF